METSHGFIQCNRLCYIVRSNLKQARASLCVSQGTPIVRVARVNADRPFNASRGVYQLSFSGVELAKEVPIGRIGRFQADRHARGRDSFAYPALLHE